MADKTHDKDCAGCHALMLVDRAESAEAARDAALRERDEWHELADEWREKTVATDVALFEAEVAREAAEADAAGLRERVATLANEVDEDWPHADHSGGNGENVLECARCWRDGLLTLATPVRHDDMKGGRES